MSDYDINNAKTSGAPQQAVVNGWVARDLLKVIASEGADERGANDRNSVLLVLAVIGIAALLFMVRNPATIPASPAALTEVNPPVHAPQERDHTHASRLPQNQNGY